MSLSPPYAVSPSQTATSVSLRTSSTTPLPSYRKSQQIRGESINTSPFGKLSYGSPLQNDLAKSSEGTKILSNNGYNRNSIILGPATEYRTKNITHRASNICKLHPFLANSIGDRQMDTQCGIYGLHKSAKSVLFSCATNT